MTSSRDLPNPGITPRSPALQADSLLSEPPRKPSFGICRKKYRSYVTLQKFWMRSLEFEPCLPDFKTYAFFTTYQSTVLSNDKSCFWRSKKSVIRMKAEDTGLTYFIESFIGNYYNRDKFYFNSNLMLIHSLFEGGGIIQVIGEQLPDRELRDWWGTKTKMNLCQLLYVTKVLFHWQAENNNKFFNM